MSVEIDEEYGGSGLSFISACLVIEEISKVDMSVSVMIDVHNTLIVNLFRKLGSPEQKAKYLPRLATDMVSRSAFVRPLEFHLLLIRTKFTFLINHYSDINICICVNK